MIYFICFFFLFVFFFILFFSGYFFDQQIKVTAIRFVYLFPETAVAYHHNL